jgi:hypothetical protein
VQAAPAIRAFVPWHAVEHWDVRNKCGVMTSNADEEINRVTSWTEERFPLRLRTLRRAG